MAIPLDRIGVALSHIRGTNVDDWVEYVLNKVDRALARGILPEQEDLWDMVVRDFQLAFTDTTKTRMAHKDPINLSMKPGELDQYITAFEHQRLQAGWGADDAGTITLFKKGLTNGLHRAVLEKTNPHPTTLRGCMEATRRQYELWAEIITSLGGNFGQNKPTPAESQRRRGMLGKKHTWAGVKKEDRMDLDAARVDALTTEEKTRLQKEGRCFHCKKMGHISRNCQQKKSNDAPAINRGNQRTTARVTEVEEKGRDERMIEDIKGMTTEDRNELLDKLVLAGF
jgi:hypothetical protein